MLHSSFIFEAEFGVLHFILLMPDALPPSAIYEYVDQRAVGSLVGKVLGVRCQLLETLHLAPVGTVAVEASFVAMQGGVSTCCCHDDPSRPSRWHYRSDRFAIRANADKHRLAEVVFSTRCRNFSRVVTSGIRSQPKSKLQNSRNTAVSYIPSLQTSSARLSQLATHIRSSQSGNRPLPAFG